MNSSVQIAGADARPGAGIEHFPVPLFAAVMGTTGLALAWQRAHAVLGAPAWVGGAARLFATGLFLLLAMLYGAKWLRFPKSAIAEASHPVRINFVSTISISLLLLATAWLNDAPGIAAPTWVIGAALHLALTVRTVSSWMHHTHYEIKHVNPAWFIPVVGNIIAPIAGVRIAGAELSWFFFSVGIVFWAVLLTIVMYRLFFHEPLPPRMMPTLFILLAPPSVGFVAWTALTGEVGAFGRILYFTALFLALVLASNALRFIRLPFFISAWAYSFPLAALTIATITMAEHAESAVLGPGSLVLLALLSMVLILLGARTAVSALRSQICVPE